MTFNYKIAEAHLDEFAFGVGSKPFLRAYAMFKLGLIAIALIDYIEEGEEAARAMAWEEADVGFRGYGDEALTGLIAQLWRTLPEEKEGDFHLALEEAFSDAWLHTDATVHPLHAEKYRTSPTRDSASEFNLPIAVPVRGPKLKEWASQNGYSAEAIEHAIESLTNEANRTKRNSAPTLTLVKGEQTDD